MLRCSTLGFGFVGGAVAIRKVCWHIVWYFVYSKNRLENIISIKKDYGGFSYDMMHALSISWL